jgi:hypothetical protein
VVASGLFLSLGRTPRWNAFDKETMMSAALFLFGVVVLVAALLGSIGQKEKP